LGNTPKFYLSPKIGQEAQGMHWVHYMRFKMLAVYQNNCTSLIFSKAFAKKASA